MHINNIFRSLIALSVILPVAAGLHTEFLYNTYSENWQDLLGWNGDKGILNYNYENLYTIENICIFIAICTLLILLFSSLIGMCFFKKWARTLTVGITIVGFSLGVFMGITISPPIESTINDLASFISGAIIAMAYLSPIKNKFENKVA